MDLSLAFNTGWIEGGLGRKQVWEGRRVCVCVSLCMYMCRGKEEKRDQNCPSANQKTQLSFSISTGKTQRAALIQWISGLDQNNYCIISSSDNPRLIQLWFACRNGSEKSLALSIYKMFPSCRLKLRLCWRLRNGCKCPRKEQFNKAKMTRWEKCLAQKSELHHPCYTGYWNFCAASYFWGEDGGSGSGEITFVSLQLAQYGAMKLLLT